MPGTSFGTVGPAAERVVTGAEVAPGVRRFDDGIVNWYLVEDEDGVSAIDAGFPPDWVMLLTALGVTGRDLPDLKAVVLTHSHIDHIGFAERARKAGATVWVHEDDAELLDHPLRIAKSERNPLLYSTRAATRKIVLRALATGAPLTKRVRGYETFRDGQILDVPGSPKVLHTPGHTYGHSALHLADRDVVFSGDAIVTRNPYTDDIGPRIVARAATADSSLALASLDPIAETDAALMLPGHGEPWTGGAREAVRLAREAGPS